MNLTTHTSEPQVSPAEIQRRVEFYCEEAFKQQAMPHAVYQNPFIVCPWMNCDYRISAVAFQIEKQNEPAFYQQVVLAFWRGGGVVGRCPGCRKYVLFTVGQKECVEDADLADKVVLPDDWHKRTHIMN